MAFGIGINNENQDAGMIRGSQQDIACECWFTQGDEAGCQRVSADHGDGRVFETGGC